VGLGRDEGTWLGGRLSGVVRGSRVRMRRKRRRMLGLCAWVRLRCPDGHVVVAVAPARVLFVASPVPTSRLRHPAWRGLSPVPAIHPRISLASAASFYFRAWPRATAFFAPKEELAQVGVHRSGLRC